MGNEYTIQMIFDHYIESILLFNGDTNLLKLHMFPGTLGNTKAPQHYNMYNNTYR